jgi:serine protease AprX
MHRIGLFRPLTSALLTAALVTLIPPTAFAQSSGRSEKLDSVLRHRARQLWGRSRVIVEFNGDADVRVFGSRSITGRPLAQRLQAAEVDNVDLPAVAADPRVARVMFDRPVFATLERTGLSIAATVARQEFGVTGRGIGVAVIDSGINGYHNDLQSHSYWLPDRVAHFKDFTNDHWGGYWYFNSAYDDYGHGTHVAGIIAGNGYESGGKHKGIAPGARLVGLKVLDANGQGYVSDVIAAIDYAISIKATYNIRVINLSVASGVYESFWLDPLTLAAKRAVDAGIVVVAAAGNLGLNTLNAEQAGGVTSPGNAPWVLTVGASNERGTARRSDDTIGTFSSRGPTWIDFSAKPDLVAPGVSIESLSNPFGTLYYELPNNLLAGQYATWYKPYLRLTGTSMAAPVVAGTVALMLEANPALTPNAVKGILQYTAQIQGDEDALGQGAGIVNARGAIRMARFFGSPTSGLGEMGDLVEGEWVPWSRHIIWGNYRIAGGVPLPGSSAWTLGLRWGAMDTQAGIPVVWGARLADNIVWSTTRDDLGNLMWSTARVEGSNIVWSTVRADSDSVVWSTAANIVWSTGGNIVWSTGSNIVWSTVNNIVWSTGSNIVWSTGNNIVWSTAIVENLVWGDDCGGFNCQQVLWGAEHPDGTAWGTARLEDADNIVWSTGSNIVWSTAGDYQDSIVSATGSNIVWSTAANIGWSTGGNIVWSTGNNIVWSTGINLDFQAELAIENEGD